MLRANVKEVWSKYVTPGLLQALINKIFSNNKSYISCNEFFTFYCKVYEDYDTVFEATTFMEFSKSINGLTTQPLLWEHLPKAITEFFYSYINIIDLESEFALRTIVNINGTGNSVNLFCKYLIKDLSSRYTNDVTFMKWWLCKYSFFRQMLHYIYLTLFGVLSTERRVPLFPKLLCRSNYDSNLEFADILFIKSKISSVHEWRLIYNMDYDGESWPTFLKAVIGQGPTVIVVYDTKGHCFGAFASKSWNVNPNFYGDEGCFLFTLRPIMNIFEATSYNRNFQYLNTGQRRLPNGLGMGGTRGYWGLFIDADFGNGNVSESCTTFKEYSKPSLDRDFKIEKLEVWGVGEPDATPEELLSFINI